MSENIPVHGDRGNEEGEFGDVLAAMEASFSSFSKLCDEARIRRDGPTGYMAFWALLRRWFEAGNLRAAVDTLERFRSIHGSHDRIMRFLATVIIGSLPQHDVAQDAKPVQDARPDDAPFTPVTRFGSGEIADVFSKIGILRDVEGYEALTGELYALQTLRLEKKSPDDPDVTATAHRIITVLDEILGRDLEGRLRGSARAARNSICKLIGIQ